MPKKATYDVMKLLYSMEVKGWRIKPEKEQLESPIRLKPLIYIHRNKKKEVSISLSLVSRTS
jgi:hypothetical protein